MKHHSSDKSKGFTLLEVIVVLLISSLITTILFQGLSVVLDTRFRVMNALTRIEVLGLQSSIMTTPLRGIFPDHPDEPGVFSGNARRLQGLTLTPLQGISGAPTTFAMELNYDIGADMTVLTYLESGHDATELARWQGNQGNFFYRGWSGDWLTSWPPRVNSPPQVPRSIRLDTGMEQQPVKVVRIMAPHNRPSRFKDTPFGSTQ